MTDDGVSRNEGSWMAPMIAVAATADPNRT